MKALSVSTLGLAILWAVGCAEPPSQPSVAPLSSPIPPMPRAPTMVPVVWEPVLQLCGDPHCPVLEYSFTVTHDGALTFGDYSMFGSIYEPWLFMVREDRLTSGLVDTTVWKGGNGPCYPPVVTTWCTPPPLVYKGFTYKMRFAMSNVFSRDARVRLVFSYPS